MPHPSSRAHDSVRQYLDAATNHLAEADAWILDDGGERAAPADALAKLDVLDASGVDMQAPLVLTHSAGAWMHVPEQQLLDALYLYVDAACPTLRPVIATASRLGCNWINFDRDASEVPGLPTYEW